MTGPYPHKMEYYIEGFLKEIGKVNSLQSLIRVCPIHCNQDQITSFIYKTLVEDDLFYAQSEEVFHISSELKISDSLVKITQQSQNGGPYGVRNSNHSYECKVFQPYALTIQALDDALKVTWPRFYKKWEKTSDGSEIYQGLVTFTSICQAYSHLENIFFTENTARCSDALIHDRMLSGAENTRRISKRYTFRVKTETTTGCAVGS
jgi:hypothetical protein